MKLKPTQAELERLVALDALQIDIFEIAKMTPGSHSYWSSYPRLHLHPPSRDAKPRGNE